MTVKMNRRMKIATRLGKRIRKKMQLTIMVIKKAEKRQFMGMSSKKNGILFSMGRSLNGVGEFVIQGVPHPEMASQIFRDVLRIVEDPSSIRATLRHRFTDKNDKTWDYVIFVEGIRTGEFWDLWQIPIDLVGRQRFFDMIHYVAKVSVTCNPYSINHIWDLTDHPKYTPAGIEDMVGRTFVSVEGMETGSECVKFTDTKGNTFMFYHESDCCESVDINDIVGDPADLVGVPMLKAEEVSNAEEGLSKEKLEEAAYCESHTWTFYKFATRKGYVDLRWLGASNGYYSENVSMAYVPAAVKPFITNPNILNR